MGNPFRAASRALGPGGGKQGLTPTSLLRFGGDPIWKEWDTQTAIDQGFKASTWVYASINRIAKSVAAVPWITFKANSRAEDPEVMRDSAMSELLRRPNNHMDGNMFFRTLISHLYLGGNAILLKQYASSRASGTRGKRVVTGLWPINPGKVTVKHKSEESPTSLDLIYEVTTPRGGKIKIPAADIVHIMFVDPGNPIWGMSPLQAASRIVDTDTEAVKWNMTALQNRSIPDGVFTFDQPLTTSQWEEARQSVIEEYSGKDNSRRPWVVGGGARWQQMSLSAAEMDWLESRKMTRDEIVAVFEVPPPLVQIYEDATLANIQTAREILWVDTIIPVLDVLAAALTYELGPDFGVDGKTSWLGPDLKNVDALQKSIKERIAAADGLWKLGIPMQQVNDILEMGIKKFEGWDQSYIPTGMMLAGDASLTGDNLVIPDGTVPQPPDNLEELEEE